MDWLTESGVPATIFATGETGTTTPRPDGPPARSRATGPVRRRQPDWDGPILTDLDAAAIGDQLDRTEAAISTFAGVTTKPWFRPPVGAWDDDAAPGRRRRGLGLPRPWDVDTRDPGYDYPADAYHYILMRILMAARANDLQAIDGPYLQIRNVDGYREVARRAAALGFDGKWVLHPGQVEAANEIFSPSQEDYDHAELILDAYEYCTSEAGGKKGSAMLGDEMIDEASRKMALVISGKGRAAGMQRTSKFEAPEA